MALDPLNHGIYSFSEAARLVGVSRSKLAAWFRGWPSGRPSVFEPDFQVAGQRENRISFLDLVDASVAAKLREHVSLTTVRRLDEALSRLWNTPHPLSCRGFYVDERGRRTFVEVAEAEGEEPDFIEVLKRQHAMAPILKPVLSRIGFNPLTDVAETVSLTGDVLLDPRRRYGKPITRESGFPTEILYEASRVDGQDTASVADWYGVEVAEVEAAVDFETRFAGIAA